MVDTNRLEVEAIFEYLKIEDACDQRHRELLERHRLEVFESERQLDENRAWLIQKYGAELVDHVVTLKETLEKKW